MVTFLKYGKGMGKHQAEAQRCLEEHIVLAEDLGAEIIRIKGRDIAKALVEIAQKRHITQLVLGQPSRGRWEEFLRGSVSDTLLP